MTENRSSDQSGRLDLNWPIRFLSVGYLNTEQAGSPWEQVPCEQRLEGRKRLEGS